VKIAYFAPEIPALSATFVYNEILQLESMGTEVVPFSVHEPFSDIQEPEVQKLKQKVQHLYGRSKLSVLKDNVYLLMTQPKCFFQAVKLLLADMWQLGLFSRTAWGQGYRFLFAASLARDLIKNDCSHIHVHFAHVPTDIAMYAAVLSNITFSVTAHANDLFERGWLLSEKVSRSAFFATISEFNRLFLAGLGVDKDKIKIIRCGVDFDKFSARDDFQSQEKIKIGLVGRLVEKKGVDVLIQALKILKDEGLVIELHIAGTGPLQQELLELAQELNFTNTEINFLGSLPHKDVSTFIKSLDIFVLPCKQDKNGDMDGIPVVLMEAMLSGVPVISTELSGIPELVIDTETGLTAEPGNIGAMASVIKKMIDNDTWRDEMSRNAINKVKSDFSLQKNTTKLNTLFKNHIKIT